MVELSTTDFKIIFSWFERTFGKGKLEDIPIEDKRAFWKLTFLAEDKIEEDKETKDEDTT